VLRTKTTRPVAQVPLLKMICVIAAMLPQELVASRSPDKVPNIERLGAQDSGA
jgi:hypothetical protein